MADLHALLGDRDGAVVNLATNQHWSAQWIALLRDWGAPQAVQLAEKALARDWPIERPKKWPRTVLRPQFPYRP
jgi:hypothetical protein